MKGTTAGRPAVRLSGLDVATHLVAGPATEPVVLPAAGGSSRDALEDVVRHGLERAPCIVSFSGGRDSSVVLAIAAHVARREGLPLPIPATIRAPGVQATDETHWQERVVRHLDLPDWHREDVTGELDFVGPVARAALSRHGLLFPAQVHFHVPLLAHATGGTLLTGAGGDDVLEAGARSTAAFAWRRAREGHQRTAVLPLIGVAPRPVRAAYVRRRRRLRVPWLTPAAHAEFDARLARELPPVAAGAALRWIVGRRWLAALRASLGLLAGDAGATILHPLIDRGFVAALVREGGWAGTGGRSRFLPRLAGDLLPRDVLLRRDKTSFRDLYWTEHSRTLAREWDGRGVDEDIVDVDALRAVWAGGPPNMATALLLQQVWLAQRAR
jgi:asparagine synthase (glutamine-hydrolysing)